MNVLYAQFIGIAAILIISFSVQCRKKKNMMLLQMVAYCLYSVQYAVLNAFSGCFMDLIAALRCILFFKYDKNKQKIPAFLTVFVILAILIAGSYTYNGYLSIIPIIISIAYTVGASFKNPRIYKLIFGIAALFWLYYNIMTGAYVCIIGNTLEIFSTSIAFYNESKTKKRRKNRHKKRR